MRAAAALVALVALVAARVVVVRVVARVAEALGHYQEGTEAVTAAVATEVAAKAVVVRAEARAEAVTVVALEVAVMEVAARAVEKVGATAAVMAVAREAGAKVAVVAPAPRRAVRKAASSATPCQTLGVPHQLFTMFQGRFTRIPLANLGEGERVVVSLCSCTYVGATHRKT